MSRVAGVVAVVVVLGVVAGGALADHHPSVLDSQPFAAGPLPGSPMIAIKTKGSDRNCGGVAITATVKKAKKMSAADKAMAAVFKLKFPAGLDFDPDHAAVRARSMKKFDAWYQALDDAARAASDQFRQTMANTSLPPADRIAAAARLVQVVEWSAYVIGRAPMPSNIAKVPEAATAFCDAMRDKADPLLYYASQAADACRTAAGTIAAGAGWWDDVCAGL